MHLSAIHTYPVKGCRRLDHDGPVQVEPWGLAGDRRWLVVDPDGAAVTQREAPALTRIQPVAGPDAGIVLRTAGLADLAVAPPAAAEAVQVQVWGSVVAAAPAGAAADAWLSKALEQPVRLVWLADPTGRQVDQAYGDPGDRVTFADGYPLLLTTTASLDALNGRLLEAGSQEGPLPMARFRPNLVVGGAWAWQEDDWLGSRLRIGAGTFRVVKACGRCVVTTTDQETGEKGEEPLVTLARYRNVDQKLLFGVLLIPDSPLHDVTVGDTVTPLDTPAAAS